MIENSLTQLFRRYAEPTQSTIIQLENKDRLPVGALYLNGNSPEDIVVCLSERTEEKYYIYIPSSIGNIALFFTYFRKLENQ